MAVGHKMSSATGLVMASLVFINAGMEKLLLKRNLVPIIRNSLELVIHLL